MYRFIETEKVDHSIRILCRVLRVSRAAFYAWRAQPERRKRSDAVLKARIRSIHKASRGTYGRPRIVASLRKEGTVVNHKKVSRIMNSEGINGVPKKRFRGTTTDSEHDHRVAPNLLNRSFNVSSPNMAWVADITHVQVGEAWAYLAVIIDLFSRKVVGWALDDHMRAELAVDALRQALALRNPQPGLVHHSDRGVQYASHAYTNMLKEFGALPSMSRKGNCWDNAVAESFFGTLKQELFADKAFESIGQARSQIGAYIHRFFNQERLHSTLDYRSPVEAENQAMAPVREAA
jgi:putative transposase